MRCFYPSLRPVSNSNDTRIREDYEAYKNRRFGKDYDTGMVENLPKLGEVQVSDLGCRFFKLTES